MKKSSFNFTKDNLLRITRPLEKRDTYRDTKEQGLTLIASYGGSKIFYFYKKIQGKPYRIKIGAFPDLSVTEARDAAVALKNKIAKGVNPAEEKNKLSNEITFNDKPEITEMIRLEFLGNHFFKNSAAPILLFFDPLRLFYQTIVSRNGYHRYKSAGSRALGILA